MHRVWPFMILALVAPTSTIATAVADSGTPSANNVATSGASSVTYYDHQGGLHSTTTIPGGSAMRHGGANDPCSFVAAIDGNTFDGTPYNSGDIVTSTRWVFSEQILIGTTEAPGPGIVVTDLSGPVPRRLVSISCDSFDHFQGTTWVSMDDPFWNPRPAAQQLRNDLQLIAPTVFTNPVVARWGGLVTRYPTWLAVDPAAWQPQRSPQATYRGWTIHLFTQPTTLDFLVAFAPDPTRPSTPFDGTVRCVDPANPGTAGHDAFPALPSLPDLTTPGVNGPCMWTPPGPGTVTIQARISYDVTLWVNGYQEPQPGYTLAGPAATYRTGELTAVNTNT